jgi:lysozyme
VKWLFREALAEHLEAEEGKRAELYQDHLGNLTIGIGRALNRNPLNDEEIYFLLLQDMKRAEAVLDRLLPDWNTYDLQRQLALGSMAFQLGGDGLSKFRKMLQAIRADDWQKAADEALDSLWARQTPNRAKRVAEMLRGEDPDSQT